AGLVLDSALDRLSVATAFLDDRGGLLASTGQPLLEFAEPGLGGLSIPTGRLDRIANEPLAILERGQQRPPGIPAQHVNDKAEDQQRPERIAKVAAEGADLFSAAGGLSRHRRARQHRAQQPRHHEDHYFSGHTPHPLVDPPKRTGRRGRPPAPPATSFPSGSINRTQPTCTPRPQTAWRLRASPP